MRILICDDHALICDISMPRLSGTDAVKELKSKHPDNFN